MLVHKADFGGELVFVDVLCEVSSDVACDQLVRILISCHHRVRGTTPQSGDVPNPPIISTAGFPSVDMFASAHSQNALLPAQWVCRRYCRVLCVLCNLKPGDECW